MNTLLWILDNRVAITVALILAAVLLVLAACGALKYIVGPLFLASRRLFLITPVMCAPPTPGRHRKRRLLDLARRPARRGEPSPDDWVWLEPTPCAPPAADDEAFADADTFPKLPQLENQP